MWCMPGRCRQVMSVLPIGSWMLTIGHQEASVVILEKKFEMCKILTFWSQLSQCNLDGMDLLQPKLSQAYKDDITVIKDRQDKRGHCGSNRQVSLKHPCLWTVWSVSYEPLICACGAPHPADRCHEPFYILGPGFEPPTFVVVSLAQVFVRLRNEFSDCW